MSTQFQLGTSYDLHLRNITTVKCTSLRKMPWELNLSTPWEVCKRLRGEKVLEVGTLPPIPGNGTALNKASFADLGDATSEAFKAAGIALKSSSDTRLWHEKLSWERKAAYKKWTSLISKQFNAWEICRQLWAGNSVKMAQGCLLESVMDALGSKATSTIHARVAPLLQLVHFCELKGCNCFPLTEFLVYDFMKESANRAPSFHRSLLLSISFANFHFGLDGADSVLSSGRVRGCSQKHYAEKRKLVQRPALTVEQVLALENTVLDTGRTDVDRIGAGFFLTLVYGRLRYSDAQQVSNLVLDMPNPRQGFLEGQAGRTKTSISLERKCRFLPIAIPTMSLGDEPWIPVWMDLRAKHFGETRESERIPLLPNPAMGNTWTRIPLGVGAGSQWLRALLSSVPHQSPTPLGTHSCKATVLSWASKWGMANGPRRLLGYHSEGRDKSLLTYSRDGMAGPLRLMCRMLDDIKSGTFLPDSTRSGRFPNEESRADEEREEAKSDASSSSSDGSDNESEVDFESEEAAITEVVGKWDPRAEDLGETDARYARHKVSRCIHVMQDEAGNSFKCGRRMSHTYLLMEHKPSFMHPLCTTCFRPDGA